MKARNIFNLFLFAVAIVAVLLVYNNLIQRYVPEEVAETALPAYLVLKKDLAEGEFLRQEDLRWQAVDAQASAVPDDAIGSEDAEIGDFDGAIVMEDVGKDDFLRRKRVLLPKESGFLASVLRPNKRAISIEVDAVTGSAGLIRPGNRVDLILFTNLAESRREKGELMAKTILENMRVIAMNRRVDYELAAFDDLDAAAFEFQSKGTATLEVSPKQAEVIAVAGKMGTLSLSLRSEFDYLGAEDDIQPQDNFVWSYDVVPEFKVEQAAQRQIIEMYGAKKKTSERRDASALSSSNEFLMY